MSAPTFERTDTVAARWKHLVPALDSLWGRSMQNQDGADVARALTHNLICVADIADAQAMREATSLLQRSSPCRVFQLLLTDDGGGAAELTATTRCHGRIRDIVLEEIVLPVGRDDFDHLPGILRPLIIDDLPSHLYWRMPWPAEANRLDRLAALCDTTIVDSAHFDDPANDLRAVRARRQRGDHIDDLAWLRIQAWRRALAEAFERFPWRPGTSVTGTIRHGHAARAAASLLADWLRERLSASLTIDPAGDARATGPDRVVLQVGDVEVLAECQRDSLVTKVTTAAHCHLPFSVGANRDGDDARLLAQAISSC